MENIEEKPLRFNINEPLSYQIKHHTVEENLNSAINQGLLKKLTNGRLKVKSPIAGVIGDYDYDFYHTLTPSKKTCSFLKGFVYNIAYQKNCIPNGCRECYKVKVSPQSLRELMGLLEIAGKIDCSSKVGIEVNDEKNSNLYGGYFYVFGLEEAKKIFALIRDAVSAHPKLGANVSMVIKRGCTDYEIKFGPSNLWSFAPELEAVEAGLELLYHGKIKRTEYQENKQDKLALFANWVKTAYRIGDSTYLDFTNGKPLLPKIVTYHEP